MLAKILGKRFVVSLYGLPYSLETDGGTSNTITFDIEDQTIPNKIKPEFRVR